MSFAFFVFCNSFSNLVRHKTICNVLSTVMFFLHQQIILHVPYPYPPTIIEYYSICLKTIVVLCADHRRIIFVLALAILISKVFYEKRKQKTRIKPKWNVEMFQAKPRSPRGRSYFHYFIPWNFSRIDKWLITPLGLWSISHNVRMYYFRKNLKVPGNQTEYIFLMRNEKSLSKVYKS